MERWTDYENKKVYVQLKSGREYSGIVLEVEISFGNDAFMTLKDKFGNKVGFLISQIKLIEVQK